MLIKLINEHFDDYKTLAVKDYIKAHKKYRGLNNEDYDFLKSYETIVVVALTYPKHYPKPKGKGYGMVSRYAHGKDYHKVFHHKFDHIKSVLGDDILIHGNADTNPIEERFAAFLSGLGYLGHNQFLIHPNFGTQLFLGTILTNLPVEPTKKYLQDDCKDCTKCMDACPPSALVGGDFIESRCLSYKTQAKETYDIETLKPFKRFVWGCDICQIVCPKNKNIDLINHEVFESDDAAQLHLESLLELSNKQFMKKYKDYAFSFRGGLVIKRNAIALLFNQNMVDSLPRIKTTYEQYKHVPWFEKTVKPIIDEMEKKQ